MVLRIDPDVSNTYKQRLCEDPKSFLDYPFDIVFSLDPAELDDIRLLQAQQKFALAKDSIKMVERLAAQNQVTAIDSFNDLLPVLYTQESLKGYPQSWLETGDFQRL